MYPHPFSVGYWRTAANELKDVRKLTFAALCIALCMALAAIPSVPLWGGAKSPGASWPGRCAHGSADLYWALCLPWWRIC